MLVTSNLNNHSQANNTVDLNTYRIQEEVLSLVPASVATKYNVIPLAISDNALLVAMANINNVVALQEMASVSKMRIEPVAADPEQIRQAIDFNYKAYGEVEKQFSDISVVIPKRPTISADIADAPAVRALDLIISEAVKYRASDIHLEPRADKLRIRYRIDGMLHDILSLPISAHESLLSRIKVMASMNIADHQPQDGQLSVRVRDQEIDVRVATINTIYGEMGSLRILDKSFAARSLTELGFSARTLRDYQQALKSPLGMILICGPTGSGKTTTLYASINGIDRKGREVITIEDPVEYRFEDINQIQVNPRAGITFASGMRSILRHDPDVILVGEIRDPDTAIMATQAALIGQLVLSSLHANDSVGSIFRLLDLGISPYLIAATLLCVVSQRMTRRVCPYCARLTKAPPEAQYAYAKEMGEEKTEFLYGQGCNACANTGYLGRVAISEIMAMNQEIRSAIVAGASLDQLRDITRKSGMLPMWRDGMLKVKDGITTPSEVIRNILVG